VLEPGKSLAFTVQVDRPAYYLDTLLVTVTGLPPGVTAGPSVVPPEGGPVPLTLTAATAAPTANQPFQVMLLAPTASVPQLNVARAPFQGRHARPGELLLNETEHPWLTVRPEAAAEPAP
jgi:hypothetical protein